MNDGLTIWIVFGGIMAAAVVFFYALKILMQRQNRKAAIDSVKHGQDVFMTWNYAPEDWKLAAEEYFQIKPRRHGENGVAKFTSRYVYVSNGKDEILFELFGADRYVKHLTDVYLLKQSARKAVKFEVRTKTIKKDDNGNDTMDEDYEVETFYVPVPPDADADGEKVLKFYKDFLDRNADAVAAVMPFGLGIFKN